MIRTFAAVALTLFLATAVTAADTPPAAPAAKEKTAPALPKPFVYTPKTGDVITGKDDAPITIVEYASLTCPHCSHFYAEELPGLKMKYLDTGKAKLVYRNFLRNDADVKASLLVQCAEPERRHAFIKVLFTQQSKWAFDTNYRDALVNIAALGGIDRGQFEACMKNKDNEKAVAMVAKEAEETWKVHSTPTFFINGKEQQGSHDLQTMSKDIDAALAAKVKK